MLLISGCVGGACMLLISGCVGGAGRDVCL